MHQIASSVDNLLERINEHAEWAMQVQSGESENIAGRIAIVDSRFDHMGFSNKTLTCSTFSRCEFESVEFDACNMAGIQLFDCVFKGCSFIDCDMHKAEFNGSKFYSCKITNCNMKRAELIGTSMNFCDLSGSSLVACTLIDADLSDSSLLDVVLDYATIIRVNLSGSNKYKPSSIANINLREAFLTADKKKRTTELSDILHFFITVEHPD